ncbi:hypothetical protein NDU88_001601, partial [Pleurodeles waltl]
KKYRHEHDKQSPRFHGEIWKKVHGARCTLAWHLSEVNALYSVVCLECFQWFQGPVIVESICV